MSHEPRSDPNTPHAPGPATRHARVSFAPPAKRAGGGDAPRHLSAPEVHSLAHSRWGGAGGATVAPRCYVWYDADARPSPRGWEARHSLNPTASKGDGLLQPQQKRKELPSRTQLGGGTTHPGTRSLKRLCRPRDHPPRLHANGQGVSLAPLDQGYRHANCWLRARQLMQKPHAPQVLSIRGGNEMIYSGNFHRSAIKSLGGGDGICIPSPAASQCHLSEEQRHTQAAPPPPNHYCNEREPYPMPRCQAGLRASLLESPSRPPTSRLCYSEGASVGGFLPTPTL